MITRAITRGRGAPMVLAVLCTGMGFVLGALAASGERMIVVPRASANLVPLNPADPTGRESPCCAAILRRGHRQC